MKNSKDKFPLGLEKVEDFAPGGGAREEKLVLEEQEKTAVKCVLKESPEASRMLDDIFKDNNLFLGTGKERRPKNEVERNTYYKIAQIGLGLMMSATWNCGHNKVEHQKVLVDLIEKFQSSMN